jgi:hypothetical protein
MAEAESAHTTSAPASSFGARVTYHDLNKSDGSIVLSVLMTLAIRRAQHERAECRRLGYDRPWRRHLSEALKRVWEIAKNQRGARTAASIPAIILDRSAALRRELELLPYREDYRAAEARRRTIEVQLRRAAE